MESKGLNYIPPEPLESPDPDVPVSVPEPEPVPVDESVPVPVEPECFFLAFFFLLQSSELDEVVPLYVSFDVPLDIDESLEDDDEDVSSTPVVEPLDVSFEFTSREFTSLEAGGIAYVSVDPDDMSLEDGDVVPDVVPKSEFDVGAAVSFKPLAGAADPMPVSFMCESEVAEDGPEVVPLAVDVSLIGATSLVVARVSLIELWSAAFWWDAQPAARPIDAIVRASARVVFIRMFRILLL